jgi:hypothetical protein
MRGMKRFVPCLVRYAVQFLAGVGAFTLVAKPPVLDLIRVVAISGLRGRETLTLASLFLACQLLSWAGMWVAVRSANRVWIVSETI